MTEKTVTFLERDFGKARHTPGDSAGGQYEFQRKPEARIGRIQGF